MTEDYKFCPYCNNVVDKKDKQCPYCLKSLGWRNSIGNINTNTQNSKNYNPDAKIYYTNNDSNNGTIRDDKQAKKNGELPPFFQKFLDLQKAGKAGDKEARKKVIKYIIIFYVLIQVIPVIIETIKGFLGE